MKNTLLTILFSIPVLLFITGCSDDDGGDDWTSAVVGTYVGTFQQTSEPGTINVQRATNERLIFSVTMESTDPLLSDYYIQMDSVMMTSETSFTFTEKPDHEPGYTGHGVFSGNTLTCTITDNFVHGFGTVQFIGTK